MNLVSARNPARHLVFENDQTEIGRFLGREFPDNPELFVYFHHHTGAYVIGAWENSAHSHFHDVLNLGPGGICGLDTDKLRQRLSPTITGRQMIDGMNTEAYRESRQMTDESMEAWERGQPRKIQIATI